MNPIAFVACLILIPSALLAQTCTLTGKVTIAGAALVASAELTLSVPDGSVKAVTSDNEGFYTFPSLSRGDYTLQATASNLALPKPVKITIHSGHQSLDLQLQIAAKAQQVTVTDTTGPSVSTEASNNANAVVLKGDRK